MQDFFKEYKPIRNKFSNFNIWKILNRLKKIKLGTIVPEVLEFTFLNSIIYSPDYKVYRKNNEEKQFALIIKQTKEFHNKISILNIEDIGGYNFYQKHALNQLKSPNNDASDLDFLYRYYFIFSSDKIISHIEKRIKMPYKDFFNCAWWLYSAFSKNYILDKSYFLNDKHKKTVFSKENLTKTMEILSIPLRELKTSLKKEIVYNQNAFITHGYIHIRKPIFETDNKLCCFYPENLLYQFTSGVYYLAEIFKKKYKLSKVFGGRFEDYVGLILTKNNSSYNLSIKKEFTFIINKNKKETSDWIIETNNSIVFIECKTKRLPIESKQFDKIAEEEVDKISDSVKQVYKVYFHYRNDKITGLKYNSNKKFIPIIVTLEEWYAGIPNFINLIENKAKVKLKEDGFETQIIDNNKFDIISINRFEKKVQELFYFGFENYFEEYDTNDFNYVSYFKNEVDNMINELK